MTAKKKKATKKKIVKKKVAQRRPVKKQAAKKKSKAVNTDAVEREVQSALKKGPKSNKELRTELGTEDKKLTRTLQRLRRRGLLQVVKGRWALNTAGICPKCGGKGWIKK